MYKDNPYDKVAEILSLACKNSYEPQNFSEHEVIAQIISQNINSENLIKTNTNGMKDTCT